MKKKIYKLRDSMCTYDLLAKGVDLGQVVKVSLPVRKGVRKLFKAKVVRVDPSCDCCPPSFFLEFVGKTPNYS